MLMLKPLIKVLLSNGVSFNEFGEWSREAFIDVADKEFAIDGKKQTSTRISVITGIFRKDVARVRKQIQKPVKDDKTSNRVTRVISAWRREERFFDHQNNEAKVLDLELGPFSFAALVKEYGGDVSRQAILSELLRLKVVVLDEAGRVQLNTNAYVPSEDLNEQFKLMGQASADILNTIAHNLSSNEESRLQLSVAYRGLSQASVDKFKKISEQKSIELLNKMDKWLADICVSEPRKADSFESYRTGLGIYYFEEKQSGE